MNTVFVKRHLTSVGLGILAGLLCVSIAQNTNPDIWGSALMWIIIANRFSIGAVVSLAGVYDRNPAFGFRMYPCLRGAFIGACISLQLAIGVFLAPVSMLNPWVGFWATLIAGAIY